MAQEVNNPVPPEVAALIERDARHTHEVERNGTEVRMWCTTRVLYHVQPMLDLLPYLTYGVAPISGQERRIILVQPIGNTGLFDLYYYQQGRLCYAVTTGKYALILVQHTERQYINRLDGT